MPVVAVSVAGEPATTSVDPAPFQPLGSSPATPVPEPAPAPDEDQDDADE